MNRKMVIGFVVVCSIVLNIAFVSMWLLHAVPRLMMSRHSCRMENGICRKCPMYETLELTDSQWQALEPGIEAYRKIADSLRCDIAFAREGMLAELGKTPTDTHEITIYRDRILNGQKKLQEQVIVNVLDQKKILTSEQHRRFIDLVRSDMVCTGKQHGSPEEHLPTEGNRKKGKH